MLPELTHLDGEATVLLFHTSREWFAHHGRHVVLLESLTGAPPRLAFLPLSRLHELGPVDVSDLEALVRNYDPETQMVVCGMDSQRYAPVTCYDPDCMPKAWSIRRLLSRFFRLQRRSVPG